MAKIHILVTFHIIFEFYHHHNVDQKFIYGTQKRFFLYNSVHSCAYTITDYLLWKGKNKLKMLSIANFCDVLRVKSQIFHSIG